MMIDFENYREKLERSGIKTSIALADHLLGEYGIALLPATDFYFDETYLMFRLAFVDFDGKKGHEAYVKGQHIDERFIETFCPNIYSGMNKIRDFVENL